MNTTDNMIKLYIKPITNHIFAALDSAGISSTSFKDVSFWLYVMFYARYRDSAPEQSYQKIIEAAIIGGHPALANELLQRFGYTEFETTPEYINQQDDKGNTLLHYALMRADLLLGTDEKGIKTSQESVDAILLMSQYGADWDKPNFKDLTPYAILDKIFEKHRSNQQLLELMVDKVIHTDATRLDDSWCFGPTFQVDLAKCSLAQAEQLRRYEKFNIFHKLYVGLSSRDIRTAQTFNEDFQSSLLRSTLTANDHHAIATISQAGDPYSKPKLLRPFYMHLLEASANRVMDIQADRFQVLTRMRELESGTYRL